MGFASLEEMFAKSIGHIDVNDYTGEFNDGPVDWADEYLSLYLKNELHLRIVPMRASVV